LLPQFHDHCNLEPSQADKYFFRNTVHTVGCSFRFATSPVPLLPLLLLSLSSVLETCCQLADHVRRAVLLAPDAVAPLPAVRPGTAEPPTEPMVLSGRRGLRVLHTVLVSEAWRREREEGKGTRDRGQARRSSQWPGSSSGRCKWGHINRVKGKVSNTEIAPLYVISRSRARTQRTAVRDRSS